MAALLSWPFFLMAAARPTVAPSSFAPYSAPMERVVLIDYGSGNVHSAHKALLKAAGDAGLAIGVEVTARPDAVAGADRLILPGVGAFAACKVGLAERPGLIDAITEAVIDQQRPFLGICVGMQLLATRGLEHGETPGLDFVAGTVRALKAGDRKIPHMGWNTVEGRGHPLLPPDGDAYFVHSYCFDADDPGDVAATAAYGEAFTAAVVKGNIAGTQFHPEKSQAYGLDLLARFLRWEPS